MFKQTSGILLFNSFVLILLLTKLEGWLQDLLRFNPYFKSSKVIIPLVKTRMLFDPMELKHKTSPMLTFLPLLTNKQVPRDNL